MKTLFTLFVLTLSTSQFHGQENSDCDWVDTLENTQEIEGQLNLVQENFGVCALVIAQGYPVSSDTSSFWFGDVKKFMESIRLEDVDSIQLLKEKAAQTLYGKSFKTVIVITFKNEKVIFKIQKRVVE